MTCYDVMTYIQEPTVARPQLQLHGRAAMVDVGGKAPTRRTASARATVLLGAAAFRLLRDNQLAKGDALAVAVFTPNRAQICQCECGQSGQARPTWPLGSGVLLRYGPPRYRC